jgi:signal transduction histidine kinase
MSHKQGPQTSRRLFVLFFATTLAPAVGLGWLGWRMIEQDRALENQRIQERREHAADLGAAALERILAEVEEQLTNLSTLSVSAVGESAWKGGKLRDGATLLVFGQHGVLHHAGVPLPYYPALLPAPEPSPLLFSPGETLEFQKNDRAGAIRFFRELANSKDLSVRAAALLRLGRNYRKSGDLPKALATFGELATLGDTPVNGLPAGLVAREGSALVFETMSRKEDLKPQASALVADLHSGRWQLTRSAYQFFDEQARRWLGNEPVQPGGADSLALAEGTESVWNDWQAVGRQEASLRGQRTLWVNDQSVFLVWRGSEERLVVLVIGPRYLESAWLGGLEPVRKNQGVEFALTDAEGRRVLGQLDSQIARQSVRTASATRLPWTLHAISSGNGFSPGELSARTRLLLAAIAMMALLVLTGGYFIHRAIARELSVAQLQSDFVAAVSHEFRTPLTTMRQLSEMLVRGRVSTDQRRQQFYEALLSESERLHRLVESLLNFGRMEAGQLRYQFEPLDASGLVRNVVAEFQQEVSKDGYHIEFTENADLPAIRADQESLARVFWNLLDNAVKYSPECRTIWVDLMRVGKRLMVRVRDQGLGIPAEEQKEIFRKFVRGAASGAASIKGTGIGLAMARQIVEAHGGEISVESAPGKGSAFTVLLPLVE